MIVIIDGYNLLKHIYPREKGKLERQRQKLIHQLGFYKGKRADTISQIVLVFDGGPWSRATREIRSGVVVIFSGQKQSADDWIIAYAERNKEKELMLVTRDRELIKRCKKYGAEVVSVVDFHNVVQNVVLEGVGDDMKKGASGGVQRYEQEYESGTGEIESEALDILMEQTSFDEYTKEDEISVPGKKKGRAETPSRKDKKRISKIKKL